MENASKALLMAGGILIAVLTIGIVVYMFNSSSGFFESSEDIEATQQITAFNKQYESYNRKLLRGTDVISVMNKATDNNKKNKEESDLQIAIRFKLIESLGYGIGEDNKVVKKSEQLIINKEYTQDNNQWLAIKNNEEAFTDFKRRIFNCTEIKYNENTGRVSSMLFVEQEIDYTEGL